MIKYTPKQNELLASLELDKPEDILTYYPYRYESITTTKLIDALPNQLYVFDATILRPKRVFRKGKMTISYLEVLIEDQPIKLTFYYNIFMNHLKVGDKISVTMSYKEPGKWIPKSISSKSVDELIGITPIYSSKKGIKSKDIEKIVHKSLKGLEIIDIIPSTFQSTYRLLSRREALYKIHQPLNIEDIELAKRTLKYEEFLKYFLSLLFNKKDEKMGKSQDIPSGMLESIKKEIPFTLTTDQELVLLDILNDLNSNRKMNRLVQGDVGSGKTIVAFISMVMMSAINKQSVFLLPTEVLMYQQADNFKKLFPKVPMVTLSQSADDKQQILKRIAQEENLVIIGTHAVFQDNVKYKDLGLAVIDEQHRFGVNQRAALTDKGKYVDTLLLSATPIPRTLASTLFFNQDISTISNTHKKFKTTPTQFIQENSIRSILPEIKNRLHKKEQIYMVVGAIEEGQRKEVRNIYKLHENLSQEFKDYRLGLLHGKMGSEEKEEILRKFSNHEIDILLSTTVIEVGIDVGNANTMIIYNAENLGLATLHQLRGRVGRKDIEGVCYLLSDTTNEDTIARLKKMETSFDGFELSYYDMTHRGIGDLLGTRQSGIPHFILGDIIKDTPIINQAKKDALLIFKDARNEDYKEIVKETIY